MPSRWPELPYADWAPCCDTVHAVTQVLGKLAARLAAPEPQLQQAALRVTARGWETLPLAAPDGSGSLAVVLDMRAHRALVEHSAQPSREIALIGRSVGEITRDILAGVAAAGGAVQIDPAPQEVSWTVPLDEDEEHHGWDPAQVERYFACVTQVALVLADYRAPFRGRCTPVNAWWGSFDLAVSLFSGAPAAPPSDDFIMRNAMDSQEIAVGWWPGDARYEKAAFYAYAHPAADDFARGTLEPDAARWDGTLGEFVLDWDDVRASPDPHTAALSFCRSAFAHGCTSCDWPPELAGSLAGDPPAVA